LLTISGGADTPEECVREVDVGGGGGFAKRASSVDACCAVGERSARRFVGRCDLGSAEVGIESWVPADMARVCARLVVRLVWVRAAFRTIW
jgi:hypothetical protein